jgi:hypothetical protein
MAEDTLAALDRMEGTVNDVRSSGLCVPVPSCGDAHAALAMFPTPYALTAPTLFAPIRSRPGLLPLPMYLVLTRHQVLDFGRLGSNMFKMNPSRVSIVDLMFSTCRSCLPLLHPRVGLSVRVRPGDRLVTLDTRRVSQIIINALRWVRV